jgi:hypothetical protein
MDSPDATSPDVATLQCRKACGGTLPWPGNRCGYLALMTREARRYRDCRDLQQIKDSPWQADPENEHLNRFCPICVTPGCARDLASQ